MRLSPWIEIDKFQTYGILSSKNILVVYIYGWRNDLWSISSNIFLDLEKGYRCSTIYEAKKIVEGYLTERGYSFISDEQWQKIQVLL